MAGPIGTYILVPFEQVPLGSLRHHIAQGLGPYMEPLPPISPSLGELMQLAGCSPSVDAAHEAHDLIASLAATPGQPHES